MNNIKFTHTFTECIPLTDEQHEKATETYLFKIDDNLAAEICLYEYYPFETYRHLQLIKDVPHFDCFDLGQLDITTFHLIEIKSNLNNKFYEQLPKMLDICMQETTFEEIKHLHASMTHEQSNTSIKNCYLELLKRHEFSIITGDIPYKEFVRVAGTKDTSIINYMHAYELF